MKQLSVLDALDLMQSDMKLWDNAEKEPKGEGRMALSLHLPWGIGEYTVIMEGLHNAQGKRNAVGAFGDHIRGIINERINDEAVTARARQAAARRKSDDSGDSFGVGPAERVREQQAIQTAAYAEATEAHGQTSAGIVGSREGLIAERSTVEDLIRESEERLKRLRRDLRVVEAALAAWEEDEE